MKNAILAAVLLAPISAQAAGDAASGATVFKKCSACHAIDEPKNKIGPNLVGIVGRKTASVADYTKYSDAMKKAGADGMVWDEQHLTEYLVAPKAFLPGNKMTFTGLKEQEDIANLIEFLKSK